jgi:hypothetical protein
VIVHSAGRDTRHAFRRVEHDGTLIDDIDAAEFTVTNAAGVDVIAWDLDDDNLELPEAGDDFTVSVLIPHDHTIDAGNYVYSVRYLDPGGDWDYASAGLLTVRDVTHQEDTP